MKRNNENRPPLRKEIDFQKADKQSQRNILDFLISNKIELGANNENDKSNFCTEFMITNVKRPLNVVQNHQQLDVSLLDQDQNMVLLIDGSHKLNISQGTASLLSKMYSHCCTEVKKKKLPKQNKKAAQKQRKVKIQKRKKPVKREKPQRRKSLAKGRKKAKKIGRTKSVVKMNRRDQFLNTFRRKHFQEKKWKTSVKRRSLSRKFKRQKSSVKLKKLIKSHKIHTNEEDFQQQFLTVKKEEKTELFQEERQLEIEKKHLQQLQHDEDQRLIQHHQSMTKLSQLFTEAISQQKDLYINSSSNQSEKDELFKKCIKYLYQHVVSSQQKEVLTLMKEFLFEKGKQMFIEHLDSRMKLQEKKFSKKVEKSVQKLQFIPKPAKVAPKKRRRTSRFNKPMQIWQNQYGMKGNTRPFK